MSEQQQQQQNRGWYIEGQVVDVVPVKTKNGKQLYRIYVLVGRSTQSVTARENGLQVGDHYRARVTPQPYINRYGSPAISCWENKRF